MPQTRIAPVPNSSAPTAPRPVLDVWGKRPDAEHPYPLLAHLLDCVVTAGAVWDMWLRPGLKDQIAEAVAGGSHSRARQVVQLLAGLHDVGKANSVFQYQAADNRDLSWRTRLERAGLPRPAAATCDYVDDHGCAARRHEYVGMVNLAASLSGTNSSTPGSSGDPLAENRTFVAEHWASVVVGGHHGRWLAPDSTHETARALDSGTWGEQFLAHRDAIENIVGLRLSSLAPMDPKVAGKVTVLLSGLVVLADWLASDDRQVDAGTKMLNLGVRLDAGWVNRRSQERPESRERAALDPRRSFTLREWVRANVGSYVAPNASADVLAGDGGAAVVLGDHEPRPLQAAALETVRDAPGLWMVTYPTGEGKTEAALLRHMARTDEGIAFALPTRATTDMMTNRFRSMFSGTGNLVLKIHQYASTDRLATDGCAHYGAQWFTTSIRRLLSPVAVMTCDQVLAASLRERHSPLRLLALANHHVVLDEVHTFDHYQSELLVELLAWLGATDTRVTLLSATMPAWMQRAYAAAYTGADGGALVGDIAYPAHRLVHGRAPATALTSPPSQTSKLHIGLDMVEGRDDAHTGWLVDKALTHPRAHVAVIVNTVDTAIQVANATRERLAGTGYEHDVVCLHSRFTHGDREEIQNRLVALTGDDPAKHGRRVLLIATQVAEASLDIDFDFMSTDLAPASSLLQRAGRLHRFEDSTLRRQRLGMYASFAPRTLRVAARTTRNGLFSYSTSLPYLAAELSRVWQWLLARRGVPIAVPGHVQRFVDATTVSLDDFLDALDATIDEEHPDGVHELDPDSAREYASIVERHRAAALTKADLTRTIARTRRTRYSQLVELTERDDDEALMRTRFIDNPGFTYLFVDPSNARPDLVHRVTEPLARLRTMRGAAVARLLPAVIQVPGGRVDEALSIAHYATMHTAGYLDGWKVDAQTGSKIVEHLLPVDVAHLDPSLVYSTFSGLEATGVEPDVIHVGPGPVVGTNLDLEEAAAAPR